LIFGGLLEDEIIGDGIFVALDGEVELLEFGLQFSNLVLELK
jgi:hypothetical protein